jgi:hypothetical protein
MRKKKLENNIINILQTIKISFMVNSVITIHVLLIFLIFVFIV